MFLNQFGLSFAGGHAVFPAYGGVIPGIDKLGLLSCCEGVVVLKNLTPAEALKTVYYQIFLHGQIIENDLGDNRDISGQTAIRLTITSGRTLRIQGNVSYVGPCVDLEIKIVHI